MTFHPSEKKQREWVEKYFNGGVCPEDGSLPAGSACYEALDWLSKQDDIHTLADAWDKCEEPEWLVWMHSRMDMSRKDVRRWCAVVREGLTLLENSGLSQHNKDHFIKEWKELTRGTNNALKSKKLRVHDDYLYILEDYVYFLEDMFSMIKDENGRSMHNLDFIRERIPNPWIPKSRGRKK